MPVASNIKELEKMILGEIKKQLPEVTKEYCHKWYVSHSDIKEIVSEEKFIKMVKESMKISVVNGKISAKFGIFQKEDVPSGHSEKMNKLWEDFEEGYMEFISKKIFK